jgi:CheY-like chemotaxis protein
MRVLLIEDDSATAQSIELMLKSEGFNFSTTDLGEEGVDLGKLYDYDIILLDLNLPDMSGFEVLRSLRVAKVVTPILVLSGLVGIEDKVKGLGFGADDYMTKPFHKDELVARIHAIVRRSKGHAQSVIRCVAMESDSVTLTLEGPLSFAAAAAAVVAACRVLRGSVCRLLVPRRAQHDLALPVAVRNRQRLQDDVEAVSRLMRERRADREPEVILAFSFDHREGSV